MSRSSRRQYKEVALQGLDRSENGVTVVMASYRPPEDALASLESLARQTLDSHRFEVILVVNGSHSDDVSFYGRLAEAHPHLNLRIIRSPLPGACHSLNLGIQAARMNWMTFVDDDDQVSPRYLEGLLAAAGPGVVPLTVIDDVHADGTVSEDNRINEQIRPLAGQVVPPEDCPRGLSFNASKLIPTDWARAVLYDIRLSSGQDIAFYAGIYGRYDFDFAVVPAHLESTYYRALSESSQSRRDLSFDFAIRERLDVLESLARSLARARLSKHRLITSLMRSQALFMRRYLDAHPEDRYAVNTAVRARSVEPFPWDVLTRGAAKTLVTSVCFPPFSDASAVTVAKRIVESGDVVDAVSADMSQYRQRDSTLDLLVSGLVGSRMTVLSRIGFSDWTSAREFCLEGWRRLEQHVRRRWPYETLYSRAMWPASHVLAALIKLRRPETRWVAEFSDPLSRTVEGAIRLGPFEPDELTEELMAGASRAAGRKLLEPTTVFDLAETLPFALADELVFTNQHQMDYMLGYSPALAELARSKAVVRPHPVPLPEFYRLADTEGPVASDRVRLAYFGGFYANRSLTEVFAALSRLPLKRRRRFTFDLFTDDRQSLEKVISEMSLFDVVSIRTPVPYLTFLHLTTSYDCLVVNDASTASTHTGNPYLPSKWSDYRGSGTAVWAIVEPGSTMAALPAEYSSPLGDAEKAAQVLESLLDDFTLRAAI